MIVKLRDGQEVVCENMILDDRDILADGKILIPLTAIAKIEDDKID